MADGYSRPIPPKGDWTILKMPSKPSKMSQFVRFSLGLLIMLGLGFVAREYGMGCAFWLLAISTLSYIKGALGW